jgi:hypothetical protein
MNQFANKFGKRISDFWNIDEDEKKRLLKEILKHANSNRQLFTTEFNEIKFDNELMASSVVLEALSEDTENWGFFYVDFMHDIIETAKKSRKPDDILQHLVEFSYIENDKRPFVQELVNRLYQEIESENLAVKLAAIWTLPCYLGNSSIKNKSVIIEKLRQQLYSDNWKVRVMAFKSLRIENLLPDGYKLSFKDKITKLLFGEPAII